MKLSDFKGEEALDVLADLIDPVTDIMVDDEVEKLYRSGKPKLLLAKYIIKNHKKSVIEILAILNRKTVEEYVKEMTLITLPRTLLELMDDEDLMQLFQSQGQMTEENPSGSATESTEEKEM